MDDKMSNMRMSLGLDPNIDSKGGKVPDRLTIVEGILHLIYRKTLLLLVPEDNNRHWIVPHNLRELCNFVYFLQSMDDIAFKQVDNKENKYQLCTDADFIPKEDSSVAVIKRLDMLEYNLRRLMQYIVSELLDYSTGNMSDDTRGMVEVLVKLIRDLPDWTLITMNKKIVRDILMYANQKTSLYYDFYSDEQRKALLDAARHNYIVSMGDVQYVLGVLSSRSNDYTIKKLTEYVRVIWSIRMTMEFYCVGVRYSYDKTKEYLYENSSCNFNDNSRIITYITRNFRDTVGGMMFTPDGNTQFLKLNNDILVKGITIIKNWIVLRLEEDSLLKNPKYKNINQIIENRNLCAPLGCIAVFSAQEKDLYVEGSNTKAPYNKAIEGECIWRTLSEGQYYRENQDISNIKTIYLNYFALFTNLLSPSSIGYYSEDSQNNRAIFYDWIKENIIALPFYSMDWMNRFYKELKKNCKENKYEVNLNKVISDINGIIHTTLLEMNDITQLYVKHDSNQKLIGNEFETRFLSLSFFDEEKKQSIMSNLINALVTITGEKASVYVSIDRCVEVLDKLSRECNRRNSVKKTGSDSIQIMRHRISIGSTSTIKSTISEIIEQSLQISDDFEWVTNSMNLLDMEDFYILEKNDEDIRNSYIQVMACLKKDLSINLPQRCINVLAEIIQDMSHKPSENFEKTAYHMVGLHYNALNIESNTKSLIDMVLENYKSTFPYHESFRCDNRSEVIKHCCIDLLKNMSSDITSHFPNCE